MAVRQDPRLIELHDESLNILALDELPSYAWPGTLGGSTTTESSTGSWPSCIRQ